MEGNTSQHYAGHRKRLKERFVLSTSSIPEYEILELILFWSNPRKDVKPLAKELLSNFGNLSKLIHADITKFSHINGVTEATLVNFLLIKEILRRILKKNIESENILSSWASVIDYLQVTMGHNQIENFRILFLNKKNILIADELQEVGTFDQTPVYPREVLKRALFHEASSIILVHNHPSGNPNPSKADISLTNRIVETCKPLGILVHDHIIIAKNNFFSFKSHLLL
jgi:DNA repair protein RadC